MPTVEAVEPYYPKLVKEFVYNMTEDRDDPAGPNFQKHAQSHAVLKPIAYPNMFCNILESQKEDILTAEDVEGPASGFITIGPKLMQGTHIADIPQVTAESGGAS
ncbi:hypothetical protein LIER_27388 [Lithospermum erythrorhizon]|uniref:Uncharacterized protein n=1 Tax=Lithospermum erythrorhizon TaxID=34254 RepID=A0AAV3RF77_LITER